MCFSLSQIYHGSLGAVTVAVRNITSSSPNFASAGKYSLPRQNLKLTVLYFVLQSIVYW